jgi:DNA-binding GntR family transcriptional regulator
LPGYYSRNQTIHNHINAAARNSMLRQIYLSLNRRLLALRFKSNFREEKWDRAIGEHEEMIKALEARDGKRMAAILRQHLLDKRDSVMSDLRGTAAASPSAKSKTAATSAK